MGDIPATTLKLPYMGTPFIGRMEEIDQLSTRLNDPACRLLTLVGPGGIGKTRLAVEVALRKRNEFPNGVYFAALQPLTSSEYLVPAIAGVLDLSLSDQDTPQVQLLNYLRQKAMLLILDNTEHLPEVTHLIQQMLATASGLKLLVTSRETLNLREEWLYLVEGLDYPVNVETQDAEAYSAVKLFVGCARRRRPDFRFIGQQEAVIRICHLVDGMPLALELAATWVKVLPCSEIAAEIQRSLDFLATNQHDRPDRHRSIQATFDHSWKLLGEEEQAVFKSLSVFRGGFLREAAEQVATASLHTLSALADKSILRVNASGRYDIQELLRQHAGEKLNETPGIKETVLNQHGEYYAQFLSQQERYLESGQQQQTLKLILGEIDNVRAAWDHNVEHKKVECIRQSLQSLVLFYDAYAWYQEGANAFARAVTRFRLHKARGAIGALLGRLLTAQGIFCSWLGQDDRARPLLREGLQLTRLYGTQEDQARTLNELGLNAYQRGEFRQAQAWFQESLAITTMINADNLMANTYHYLCLTHQPLGEYEQAKRAGETCFKLRQQLGQSSVLYSIICTLGALLVKLGFYQEARQLLLKAMALSEEIYTIAEQSRYLEILGTLNHALGDYEQARQDLEASLVLAREAHIPRRITFTLCRLGELACTQRNFQTAQQRFQEGLHLASEIGQPWQQLLCRRGLGSVAYYLGDYLEARRLQQETLALCSALNVQPEMANLLNDLGLTATALNNRSAARQYFAEALKIGRSMQALPIILSTLLGIAELFMSEGEHAYAVELLTVVPHHPACHAETRQHASRLLVRLDAELPPEGFAQMQQSGQVRELDMVVAALLDALAPDGSHPSLFDPLTRRELEVLHLLTARRTNREIADELVISVGTVKTHVHNICSKLRITNRRQAAARARELHLT